MLILALKAWRADLPREEDIVSVNIVSLAMQYLSPELIGKIASALGLDRNMVTKAITAAVPAILGGAVDKSSSPEGARQLFDILGKQDKGLLENLGGMLGGQKQTDLISGGSNVLSSILGGANLGVLSTVLGKFAGVGEGGAKSLLGMLGPVVMGILGKQVMSSKLDAGGLASLLSSQKDNIAAAMPSGFANMLSNAQISSVTDTAKSMSTRATQTATNAARDTAAQASGGFKLWPVIAAIVIAAGAWWYLSGGAPKLPGVPPAVETQAQGVFKSLKDALGEVKDAASVKAAEPKLKAALTSTEAFEKAAATLPADGKKAIAGMISGQLPAVRSLADSALKQPEAGTILKPILDKIFAALEKLAKA